MKKTISRFFIMAFSFMLILGFIVTAPVSSIIASAATGKVIKSVEFEAQQVQHTLEISDEEFKVYLPSVKVVYTDSTTAEYMTATLPEGNLTVKIVDPKGKVFTDEYDFTSSGYSAVSENSFSLQDNTLSLNSDVSNGRYKVSFAYSEGDETYTSETYNINVNGKSYSLDFTDFDGIVPTKTNKGLPITLPKPSVISNDDVKVNEGEVSVKIVKNSKQLATATYSLSQNTWSITYADADVGSQSSYSDIIKLENNDLILTPDIDGNYEVTYKFVGHSDTKSKVYSISVTEDFETDRNDLTYDKFSFSGLTMNETVDLLYSNSDKTTKRFNVYYEDVSSTQPVDVLMDIIVTNVNAKTDNNPNGVVLCSRNSEFDSNSEYFGYFEDAEQKNTTELKLTYKGDYKIYYKISDFFGNEILIEKTISNIDDNRSPKVYFVEDYDLAAVTGIDDVVQADYLVPTQWGYKNIELPAIYSDDLGSDFTEMRTIKRTIKCASASDTTEYDVDALAKMLGLDKDKTIYSHSVVFNFINDNFDFKTLLGYDESTSQYTFETFIEEHSISNWEELTDYEKLMKITEVLDELQTTYEAAEDPAENTNPYKTKDSIVTASKYTIRYSVQDKNLNYGYSTEYSMYMSTQDSIATDTKVSIDLEYITDYITANETITFAKPTASDYVDGNSDYINGVITETGSNVRDSRVEVKTYYTYYDKSEDEIKQMLQNPAYTVVNTEKGFQIKNSDSVIFEAFTIKENDDGTTMSFNITDDETYSSSNNSMKVMVVATSKYSSNENISVKLSNEINIIDVSTDKTAPEFVSMEEVTQLFNGTERVVFGQGEKVTIPTVTFNDVNDPYLKASVKAYTTDGDDITIYNTNVSYESGNTIIGGGYFTTTAVGIYHIVYTVVDAAGNATNYITLCEVESTETPIISVKWSSSLSSVDFGSTVTLPNATVIQGDSTVNDAVTNITISGPGYSRANNKVTFTQNGEYTITYSAYVKTSDYDSYVTASGEANEGYSLVTEGNYVYAVNDTSEDDKVLVMIKADDLVFTTVVSEDELEVDFGLLDEVPTTAPLYQNGTVYNKIYIPDFKPSYSDIEAIDWDNTKITVKYSDTSANVTVSEDADGKYFEPSNGSGEYIVTYTVMTTTGKTATEDYTIKVGDNTPPVITVESSLDTLLSANKTLTGDSYTLVIKASDITVTDKGWNDEDKSDYVQNLISGEKIKNYIVVRYLDTDTVISGTYKDGQLTYILSNTGKYSVTITITDDNNNTTTKSYNFALSTNAEDDNKNDSIVGMVLIVISLLILGGVIAYFSFAGKGNGGNSGKTKRTKKESSKNKKVEGNNEVVEIENNLDKSVEDVKEESKVENDEIKDASVEDKTVDSELKESGIDNVESSDSQPEKDEEKNDK